MNHISEQIIYLCQERMQNMDLGYIFESYHHKLKLKIMAMAAEKTKIINLSDVEREHVISAMVDAYLLKTYPEAMRKIQN